MTQTIEKLRYSYVMRSEAIVRPVAPGVAYVVSVYVNTECRRMGLGTLMMKRICADADHDKIKLYLEVDEGENMTSGQLVEWYSTFGFRVSNEKISGWVHSNPALIVMRRLPRRSCR